MNLAHLHHCLIALLSLCVASATFLRSHTQSSRQLETPSIPSDSSLLEHDVSASAHIDHENRKNVGLQVLAPSRSPSFSHLPTATPSNSPILLNEDFQNVSSHWQESTDGLTAYFNRSMEAGYHVMTNTISYCGPGVCYRAEYKIPPKQRTTFIPSVNSEYWLGFSNRIPADWVVPPATYLYEFDVFQIHGGTNYAGLSPPPNFALRIQNGNFVAYVCGGLNVSAGDYSCQHQVLAPINTGTWNHWVIHSILTPGTNGIVKVWLNNTLLCDLNNLMTSYNDPNVPYMKFGVYEVNWKSPNATTPVFDWISVSYRRLILGSHFATYNGVYTGTLSPPSPPVLLNERFINLDYWLHSPARHIFNDYSVTSYASTLGFNVLTFNMTNCSFHTAVAPGAGSSIVLANQTTCADPFLVLKPQYRLQSISKPVGEYWLAFSNLIPVAWQMPPKHHHYEIDIFQLRRNISLPSQPVLALRMQAGEFIVLACGNAMHNSSGTTCVKKSLGRINQDTWNDWVIHSRLSHTTPNGFVEVWRSNVLMANLTNLLTACYDDNPPVISLGLQILGTSNPNMTAFSYVGVSYKAMRIGTATASYSAVYTGNGVSKCSLYSFDLYFYLNLFDIFAFICSL